MGTISSWAPARTDAAAPVGVEDLVGDHGPERRGRRVEEAGPGPGHGVEGHGGEVAQVGEEAPVGHVLAEGDPVDLLEPGHQGPVRSPGHDLVAEGGRRHRLGHPHHQGGVEASGPGRRGRTPRASRPGGCRGTPRPRATAPARGRRRGRAAARRRVSDCWAASTTAGSIWDLRNPRAPPPCTAAVVTVPTDGPPSGAWSASDGHGHHHDQGHRAARGPAGRARPPPRRRRATALLRRPPGRPGRRPGPGTRRGPPPPPPPTSAASPTPPR